MRQRFDLLLLDNEQRVRRVAEADLTLRRAEERLVLYDAVNPGEPLTAAIAQAGKYCAGESFEELWHDEEE